MQRRVKTVAAKIGSVSTAGTESTDVVQPGSGIAAGSTLGSAAQSARTSSFVAGARRTRAAGRRNRQYGGRLSLTIPHARTVTAPSLRCCGHDHGEQNEHPELPYASLSQLARQIDTNQFRLQRARS